MKRRSLALSALALFVILTAACKDKSVRCLTCPVPGPTYPAIDSENALIENLRLSYQRRDYDKFATLFANDPTQNAEYFFKPTLSSGDEWGLTVELRIHRRMFHPENPDPGATAVPGELWLQSITITLSPQGDFVERTDLYNTPANPSGLDPARFRATDAIYNANVFFNTAGNLDYQVTGNELFVVITDKTKSGAEPGHFLLLRWEDVGGYKSAASNTSWGAVKSLYRT